MPTSEFQIEVKSDIQDWLVFLTRLLNIHKSKAGSALGQTRSSWKLELTNEATTQSRIGEQFNYFQAVDTGRKAITRGGYLLRFAAKEGADIQSHHVGATAGYHISAKAGAKINAGIHRELTAAAAAWVVSADEDVIQHKALSVGAPLLKGASGNGRFYISGSRPLSPLGNVGRFTIARQGAPIQNETPIDGQPSSAKVRELLAQSKKTFDVDKILAEVTTDPKILAQVKSNPGIRRLIKLPQWPASQAIFAGLVADQVEKFKAVTPSRAETGSFKLVYVGGGTEILDPKTGGSLRQGYRLTTTGAGISAATGNNYRLVG